MSESEMIDELNNVLASIKNTGENMEKKSIEYDKTIKETLQNSRKMCDRYLGKAYNDSFNL